MELGISQAELDKIRNSRYEYFSKCRSQILQSGFSSRYFYSSKAIAELWESFKDYKVPAFDANYRPNPHWFQYDLELYIFLNFKDLLKRELELETNEKKIKLLLEIKSPTLLPRERHLANAASIRWPAGMAPDGTFIGDLAITPWLMDYFYGVANYANVIEFGGAGQGKTYGPLAFMSMIYDYFINTQKGAQCTFSTVTESKLKGSTWPYINRLYRVSPNRYQFSICAGLAKKCGDYTYNRLKNGKVFEEGGTLKGVLIPRGRKDASVVDKLTGFHDPEARIYLLDEGQSTDDAPLGAYNNMFLHPKFGWFNMAGNYDESGDLLDRNTEPNVGWDGVDEKTHMWEGTIKTRTESLDHKSLVIHFNNDLSPGVLDKEFGKKYHRFVPTQEKKDKSYPTEDSRKTIAYKRFWIGFRFEKETDSKVYVLTSDIIEETKCHEQAPDDFLSQFVIGSFDSAPASVDRNIFTALNVGTTSNGLPMVEFRPGFIKLFSKPRNDMEYYRVTCDRIIEAHGTFRIEPGHFIMDWTARPAHIEMLAQRGYPCHHLIYQEKVPDKPGFNNITKASEDRIPLESIPMFVKAEVQKNIVHYADQAVTNKITLGAYIFRMFVEAGRVRGFNSSLLTGLECETFEKEFLKRQFIKITRANKQELLTLDSKEDFKGKYNFSPDVMDTFFQAFYMLYVIYGIRPTVAGLGKLRKKIVNKKIDKYDRLWHIKHSLNV